MPEIRYRRLDAAEPQKITAYGQEFREGEYVPVDDKTAAKARGNRHFEVKGEKSFGDEPARQREPSTEEEEARDRAEITQAGAQETQKARQAEARGARHRDDRA